MKPEKSNASRARLRKLSEQNHLLLHELKQTKNQLRKEVWARKEEEEEIPTSSDPLLAWLGGINGTLESPIVTSSTPQSNTKPLTVAKMVDGRRHFQCSTSSKRSRSETDMNPLDIDTDGYEKSPPITPETGQPSPFTRIDMLPIMASTGQFEPSGWYIARNLWALQSWGLHGAFR